LNPEEDEAQDDLEMETDQIDNSLEGLSPIASIDRDGDSGADTLANESDLNDAKDDFVFENFRDTLIASGLTSAETAAANLLSLSGLTDYSSRVSEETFAELSRYAAATIAYDAKLLWSQIEEAGTSFEAEFGEISHTLGAVSVFGVAGYVLWTLRGGVLMAAAMSQLPNWRMVDPLPLLDTYSSDKNQTSEDDVTVVQSSTQWVKSLRKCKANCFATSHYSK